MINELLHLRQMLNQHLETNITEDEDANEKQTAELNDEADKPTMDVGEITIAIQACQSQLEDIRTSSQLVHFEVGPDEVSHVISDWTGIPMGKMLKDETKTTLSIKDTLNQQIKGQPFAMSALAEGIQTAKAGLVDQDKPTGVFLLVGPSGVGKTETARAIAEEMFGGERFMVTINMSEFQEKHTVSRLIGSPPGYVGYGEGGMLTEAVRQRPYSVVLLDEVEKADPEVLNLFYQVFDKGVLNDGEGRAINFKNTLILLTSNLATQKIEQLAQLPELSVDDIENAIRPSLNQHFKPALLARMFILPYMPLNDEAMKEIVLHKLDKVATRLHERYKLKLDYQESLIQFILDNCKLAETGARNIDAVINRQLLPQLSHHLLVNDLDDHMERVSLSVNDSGKLCYDFS